MGAPQQSPAQQRLRRIPHGDAGSAGMRRERGRGQGRPTHELIVNLNSEWNEMGAHKPLFTLVLVSLFLIAWSPGLLRGA